MPTVDEQLLRLKDYPARVIFGRATQDGVLVFADDIVCENADDAIARIQRYEAINFAQLPYAHEIVPIMDTQKAKEEMRQRLQREARRLGLPTKDWV